MSPIAGTQVLHLLTDALARKLQQSGHAASRVDADTDLIAVGLLDSQGLLDMILDAEEGSGHMFDAEGMDFEHGVTLRRLAAAFAPA